MRYWQVIFATLVIFGAGVITGGLLVNNSYHAQVAASAPVSPATNPAPPVPNVSSVIVPPSNTPPDGGGNANRLKKDFLTRYGQQLQLTPEQDKKIEIILSESQNRTREISAKIAPELHEEVKRTRERIKAELNPEQAKKFDELIKPVKPKKKNDENRTKGTNHPPVKVNGTNSVVTGANTNPLPGTVTFTNAQPNP